MVVSERSVKTLRYETCQLDDMMREVCLHKAEEENFVQIIQGTSTANSKSRRLAVESWPVERFNVDTVMKNPSLRTLLSIGGKIWKATSLLFTRHKLMRVLDLYCVEFEGGKLPSSIGKLIHLRYLSLREAHVNRLPSSMRNLKQLMYLNLNVWDDGLYMPNIVKEMLELAYLYLSKSLHDKAKLELKNLIKLETLKNFHGNVSDLQDMTREALSSSLIKLTCLERDYKDPTNDDDEVGFVLNSIHLRQLWLRIYMPRLPDEKDFPSHLTTIYLAMCRLEEDPMPILEKLLNLKQVHFWENAFCGKRMVCSRGGFPQLQNLQLWRLEELEEWRVEDGSMPLLNSLNIWKCDKFEEWKVEQGSMPLLSTLRISKCEKLTELRNRLQFITSVKDLTIEFENIQCMRLSEEQLPSHLTTISLARYCLEEDPMPILEKLLHLKEIVLEKITFSGRRMVCSSGGFPQLQRLNIKKLNELEEWRVEDGSMPLLNSLVIWDCDKFEVWTVEQGSMPLLHSLRIADCKILKELRDRLRFITSVKHLSVFFNHIQCMRLSEEQLPSHITSISLDSCCLEEDPMPVLEKLLHLENISFKDLSFSGNRMVCSRGGFPQLQELKIKKLKELEEWIVEEDSMPLLHTLVIRDCWKLKELPEIHHFLKESECSRYGRPMGEEIARRRRRLFQSPTHPFC